MGKKKETIEELLRQVLLSDEEQPYEVPQNWVWAKLGGVFEQGKKQIQPTGNEKYIGLEHMNKGGGILEISNTGGVKSKKVVFKKNDVLYGKLRPYLNKHAYVEFEGVASTDILVYRNKNTITNKLLNMYLGLPQVLQYANENSSGINLPRVSPKVMDNMAFPLPPLNEQKKIVEKVEHLLRKIAEAKQLVVDIPETLHKLKLSVLQDACSGRLTVDWRRAKGLESEINSNNRNDIINIPNSWSRKKLKEISEKVSVGHVGKTTEHYCDESVGIPFIRSQNVRPGKLDLKEVKYITKEFYNKLKKSQLQVGDLLVVRVGANRGDACIVPEGTGPLNCANIVFARPQKGLSPYLSLYFQSNISRNLLIGASTGSAQGVINTERVAEITVPLPSEEEQKVIVEKVRRIFNSIEKVLEEHEQVVQNIESLYNSTLSKAFRGELGTNSPDEENAIELLKEILQEQVK